MTADAPLTTVRDRGPTDGLPPDHARRDDAIAINTYTTVQRRAVLAHEVFAAYWRDAHGPLCSRVPGLGFYVQHHFTREHDAHLWPLPDGLGPLPGYVLDGAVEIGFATPQDQAVFQDASPVLFSDEQNVFEETLAYALPGGSRTVLDRQADATPNGPDRFDRLHLHLSARPGGDLAGWVLEQLVPVLVADPGVVKVRVHAPEPYDDAHPAPPAPRVRHTAGPGRTSIVVLEVAFTDPLARRRLHASAQHEATLPGLAQHATHVTAFAVAGVHTFVRDGRLTTAGLRGSRVAELITAVAATNQVEDPVRHLMATGTLDGTG